MEINNYYNKKNILNAYGTNSNISLRRENACEVFLKESESTQNILSSSDINNNLTKKIIVQSKEEKKALSPNKAPNFRYNRSSYNTKENKKRSESNHYQKKKKK